MKGKLMSQKTLRKQFLCIQALYSGAVRVLLWKKEKEHLLNKNENILMNEIFCSLPHIQREMVLFHSYTNQTVQKHL